MKKFLTICGIFMLKVLASTWRIKVVGHLPQKNGIVIVWHGLMLVVWRYLAYQNAIGVTSKSKDGEILASILKQWGYDVIRGSSSTGGNEVLEQMITFSKHKLVIVTPDGPRGPSGVPKAGAFVAAQRSGAYLYPCRVAIKRAKYLRSWDTFAIPLPFTRCEIDFTDEINVDPNGDREYISDLMEKTSKLMT